jgi:hypothetical protein
LGPVASLILTGELYLVRVRTQASGAVRERLTALWKGELAAGASGIPWAGGIGLRLDFRLSLGPPKRSTQQRGRKHLDRLELGFDRLGHGVDRGEPIGELSCEVPLLAH